MPHQTKGFYTFAFYELLQREIVKSLLMTCNQGNIVSKALKKNEIECYSFQKLENFCITQHS